MTSGTASLLPNASAASGASMKLRFTIRDLFWLAVVVALALGWWFNVVWMQRNLSEDALKQTVKAALMEREREATDERRAVLDRQRAAREKAIRATKEAKGASPPSPTSDPPE